MSITNTPKPSAAVVTNTPRISHQETWDSNTTTWDTETRTWDQMGTKITNTAKVSSSITNTPKP